MSKRILIVLFCAVMMLGLMSSTVFALSADDDDNVYVTFDRYSSKDFSGSGTKEDPFYVASTYNSWKKSSLTIDTENPKAKIDEETGSKTFPLSYGFNDIKFMVTSSDATKTVYYDVSWQRLKQTRPVSKIPEGTLSSTPTTSDSSDGKIIGLDKEEYYEYKLMTATDWSKINGETEIKNLSQGTYQVKYGESDSMKASSDGEATKVTVGNAGQQMGITNKTDYTLSTLPSSAAESQRIDVKLELSGDSWVKKIDIKWHKTPSSGFSSSSDLTVYPDGYTVENGIKYYNAHFLMPTYDKITDVRIEKIELSTGQYYSVEQPSAEYLTAKITPTSADDTLVVNKNTVYKKNSNITVAVDVNQTFGTRELKSFKLTNGKGETIVESQDGTAISVSITEDLKVSDVVTVTIYADFTAMEAQKERVKDVDLTAYTDTSRVAVEEKLSLSEQMYKVTQKDQELVDDFVADLKAAIDALAPKAGDFSQLNDLIATIPQDLSVYTDPSVAALNAAKAKAQTAIDEGWNRLRQSEIDAMAKAMQDAIAALQYKDADYSKVEAAIAKAEALDAANYTDFSAVTAAVKAVVPNKNITEQNKVDGYATAIEIAINTLVVKPFPFKDIAENVWYKEAASYCYNHELLVGVSEDAFAPDMELTRGMAMAIIYRIAGEPEVTATASYPDVAKDKYYTAAIAWAKEMEIAKGCPDGKFYPNMAITREAFCALLHRFDSSLSSSNTLTLKDFTDSNTISAWAKSDVEWAINCGIVSGYPNKTLQPQNPITRAEATMIFYQYLK